MAKKKKRLYRTKHNVDVNLDNTWGVEVSTRQDWWSSWSRYTSFRRAYQAYQAIEQGSLKKYHDDISKLRITQIEYINDDVIITPIEDLTSYLRELKLMRILNGERKINK